MKRDEYFKLIKNYNWRSVFFSYFTLFFESVNYNKLFLVFIRVANDNAIKKLTDNSVRQSFYKKYTTVNQVFREINGRHTEIATDTDFKLFLCCDDINEFNTQKIYKTINSYTDVTDYWDSVYIYGRKE